MRVSESFSGKYFKATDLPQPAVLTMAVAESETMPDTTSKHVLQFHHEEKRLVLNKINATTIAALYGDDSAAWNGRQIEIYATSTNFGGKVVPCVRVRAPQQPAAAASPQSSPAIQQQQPQAVQQPLPDIPPQQPTTQQPQYAQPQPPQPPIVAPLSDIPFEA